MPGSRADGGHLLAIGAVEVPDRAEVRLTVNVVAEVTVGGQAGGWAALAGTGSMPAVPRRRRRGRRARLARYGRSAERVTWRRGMPDSALRNTRSIWGGPGEGCSVAHGEEAVDLEFIRGLPPGSVSGLSLTGDIVPGSFAAIAHLAPGLRDLNSVCLDDLGEEAPSVIAELTALEALSLLGGSYTEHGLQQLRRLPKLRHLHIEREDLTAPMFRFAAAMPALTRLTGLDELGDDSPMSPAEVDQVRAMLPPHISMD